MATLMKNVSKDLPENDDDMENEIEENINHLLREQEVEDKLRYDEIINANSIEDALNKLDVNESMKHPEKKVKAVILNIQYRHFINMLRTNFLRSKKNIHH